jgi:hypothetical protein
VFEIGTRLGLLHFILRRYRLFARNGDDNWHRARSRDTRKYIFESDARNCAIPAFGKVPPTSIRDSPGWSNENLVWV